MANVQRKSRLRAQGLFVLYALRLLAPRLTIMVVITAGGGVVVRARDPRVKDFVDAAYQVYTQLFFEHVNPLPADGVLRAVYFGVPLLGALVLAEGLFKLGASLLDFQSHRETWMRIMAKTLDGHVILVGLGHVGFRVLEELLRRDQSVVVIEQKDSGQNVEEARARGVPVIVGDARRESLLMEVGVERCASVVACTDDDLVNLEVALDARKVRPDVRLVMRMFDQNMAEKIGNAFSVESTFSTSALAAPSFAAAALDESIHGAYRLGETLMVSLELAVPKALVESTVHALEEALQVPVIGLTRRGKSASHRFARTEVLENGDAVVCHVPADEVSALRARAAAL